MRTQTCLWKLSVICFSQFDVSTSPTELLRIVIVKIKAKSWNSSNFADISHYRDENVVFHYTKVCR